MRNILTLTLIILGGAVHAASPMDGTWKLTAFNRNGIEVELKEETVVSIKDGKFQTVKDGKIDGDIGSIEVIPEDPFPGGWSNHGIYDVVLTDGNKHYGRWKRVAIHEKSTNDPLVIGMKPPIGVKLITCVNNVPDGERPTEIKAGEDINLCEWEKINEDENHSKDD